MRNDIHSPSNFEPANYTYVGSFDQFPEPGAFLNQAPDPWSDYETEFGPIRAMTHCHAEYLAGRDLLRREGAHIHYDPDQGGCDCDHCGARIRYVAVYRHKDGQVIAVGNDCANNRFSHDSRREYDIARLKDRAADARERAKVFGRAEEFCQAHCPELAPWMLSPQAKDVHDIFADMARKLIRFGSLSDKQVGFARRLLQDHLERQKNGGKTDRQLQWDAEKAKAQDAPTGRAEIIGQVLKIEWRDTEYGPSLKMTVKDDRGFVVWTTCPAQLADAGPERGDRVRFWASLTPSDNDPKFAFGKRPTGGEKLQPQKA